MATKRASLILSVDGGAKFKQDLNNATKETRLYKTELETVQETYRDNANSMEALSEKQKALLKIQQSYQKQLAAAQAGHDHAVKEYEKQAEAVDKLSDQLEEAKKALDDYRKSGGSDSTAVSSLQKNVDDISTALDRQKLNLSKAEGKVTDWQKAQVKAAKDLNGINREIGKNEKYLDEAAKSADGCARSIDQFGKETSEAAKDVGELSGTSSTMMDTLKGMVGADFITSGLHAVADAAKEAIEYVINAGSEYEAAMSKVEALSGATGSELDALDQKARELGASTQFSASEVAEAMSNMALAGWDTKEMLDGIDGVLYLAASGQMDLANASDAVAGYLAAFNMEASEASRLADIMATAQAKSKTTADQLAEAYSTSATNLTGYGQDITTTTALLEAMASVNDTGSAAGTKLNAVMAQTVQKMEDGVIAIGDTSVKVQDANGDFRSMIDILEDIEKATDGLADADKAAALQQTFNRTSLSGLNELLAVGSEKLRTYQQDLQNCDGAAADMAGTMNDNLKGDLTELGSAVEGLGIAVFNQIDGPLRGAVDLMTGAVSGLTKVLDSPKSKFDVMVDDMEEANERIENVMKSVDAEYESANHDAERVAILVSQLKNLNDAQQSGEGTEADALSRKMQMQAIIDELGDSIPEITAAWNAETGELNLNNQELSDMVENYKNLAVQQAAMNAMQEVTNGLVEAQISLEEGQANATYLEDRKEALEGLKDAWWEYLNQYEQHRDTFSEDDAEKMKAEQINLLDDALRNNLLTLEEYDALQKRVGTDELGTTAQHLTDMFGEAARAEQEQNEELEELAGNVEEAQEKYDKYGQIVSDATAKIGKSAEETGEAAEKASDAVITFSLDGKDSSEEVSEGYDEIADSSEEAAETVEASAEQMQQAVEAERKAAEEAAKAQEEANLAAAKSQADLSEITRSEADRVVKALDDVRAAAEQTIKADFFSEFNGGTDETIDAMIVRAQANITALQDYQDNLKTVSDHVGQEIAPEFLAYLESLGTDGANMLRRIAEAFEQDGGSEKVREWSDAYLETMNIKDETADILAGDKIVLQDGLREIASTDVDFNRLRENIDIAVQNSVKGWERLPEETQEKLNETVRVCRAIGVKIPDGLSDGIISGKESPEGAIEQLQAAIQGRFEGLISYAQEQGLDITENISEGMNQGGDALVNAYLELLSLITQTDASAKQEMNSKGADDGAEYGKGVGSATSDAQQGAQQISDAASSTLADNISVFENAGSEAAKEYASGMESNTDPVNTAAGNLANAAKQALDNYESEYREIGKNIDYGIAQGIYAGKSWVTDAAASVASSTVDATKTTLGIQSPSKVFRDEVGVQLPAGIAEGVNKNSRVAVAAVSKLSSAITKEASESLTERQKQQDVSKRDEANYWKALADTVEEGTSTYQVAMQKYQSANTAAQQAADATQKQALEEAAKNFGVSRTKTEGSGKKKKTVLKEAEEYYSEIYSAASKYFSNIKSVANISAEQEKIYWETVASNLQVGTDAWYNAREQMQNAQQQMARDEQTYAQEAKQAAEDAAKAQEASRQKIVNDAEDYIRKKKILDEMSIQQELDYWVEIQGQLDTYTDQWYDVYEKIKELKTEIADQQKQAEEEAKKAEADRLKAQQDNHSKLLSDWKVYYKVSARAEMDYWNSARKQFKEGTDERIQADNEYIQAKESYYSELKSLDQKYRNDYDRIQKQMQDSIDDLTRSYKDAVKAREDSILSSMNLFDAWDSEGVSGQELLKNLTTQVEGLERYTVVLEQLKGREILDESVIEELVGMGPDAAANIAGLAELSDAELRKYNDLYLQRQSLAHQQALSDNKTLLRETVDGITEAQEEAKKNLKELNGTYQTELADLNATLDPALQHWLTLIGALGKNYFDGTNGFLSDGKVHSELRDAVTEQAAGITTTIEAKLEQLEQVMPNIGERALSGLMASLSDKEKVAAATDDMIQTIKDELLSADFSSAFRDIPAIDFSGLNHALNVREERKIVIDNTEVLDALNRAVRTIESLAGAFEGANVVLDTGATVGALHTALSQAQADEYLTYNRGRL